MNASRWNERTSRARAGWLALCVGCASMVIGVGCGSGGMREGGVDGAGEVATDGNAPPDADPDANDAMADGPADATVDTTPPAQGSAEAMLREVCAGRPRTGPMQTVTYTMNTPMGYLRSAAPGDYEAIRLTLTEPFRVRRIRVNLRGRDAGRARVHLMADIGRAQPDTDVDLMPPQEVDAPAQAWYDINVDPPVDLYPAHHAWIVVEHVTEPISLAVGAVSGTATEQGRSRWRILATVNNASLNPQGDPWLGLQATQEFMVEAIGERICARAGDPFFADVSNALTATPPMSRFGRNGWTDIDGDGWEDLILTQGDRGMASRLVIFRNQHDGRFENITARTGLADVPVSTATWADLDDDGDIDLVAGDYQDGMGPFPTTRGTRVYLQGSGNVFTRVDATLEPSGPTDAVAMADCDADGRMDLFIGQWLRTYPTNPGPSMLFRGTGMGRFDDITTVAGLPPVPAGPLPGGIAPAFSAMWADYDNDGDQDLFVANYLGMPNNSYRNGGNCRFTDVRAQNGFQGDPPGFGTSFGLDFADYDNDGDLDAFEANIVHGRGKSAGIDRSRLLRNTGAPNFRFESIAGEAGIFYNEGDHEGMFGDWDNDGDLDLIQSVGPAYGYQRWRLYRQEANHFFVDATYLAGFPEVSSGGVMFYDFDRDGDLDIAASTVPNFLLLRNDTRSSNHWIEVRVRHPMGMQNLDAIGARITVVASDSVRRMREVTTSRGFHTGASPATQHFGLGASGAPVTIEVRWPAGSGTPSNETTRYTNIAPDHLYFITRGGMPTMQ